MMFVDDILTYFRGLGHAAEYGTLAQLNEQLTSVDYAASTDGMVAFVRLIGEQRTVDGYDQCDIAVHLSWLCPLDFDGETMLSTQEQAKDTLKAWINHLRSGNTVTVSEDARWQFGYDDFAENVAWVAVRVTLTAAAADCVPLFPEPDYFFFEAIEPGSTICFRVIKAYSFNEIKLEISYDGKNWEEWISEDTGYYMPIEFDTITLQNAGDRLYIRGDNYVFGDSSTAWYSTFAMTGKISCGGEIRTMFDKRGFTTVARYHPHMCHRSATLNALVNAPKLSFYKKIEKDAFNGFLSRCEGITSISKNYLPWTELNEGCYRSMFYGTKITESPILPAPAVPSRAYVFMFAECPNLSRITCLATNITEENCTERMTDGVAGSGIFVKSENMEDWTVGVNGIPDGWTVENYQQ